MYYSELSCTLTMYPKKVRIGGQVLSCTLTIYTKELEYVDMYYSILLISTYSSFFWIHCQST